MAPRLNAQLKVLMNGHLLGWLRSSSRGAVSFVYEESWLSSDNRRPISLSLPLSNREYHGQVVENYFDNLLPDSFSIRSRLQARVGAETSRCFDLLAQIGRDCVGALQLLPEGEDVDVHSVKADQLTEEEIESILKNYRTMPLGVDLKADFRISVAGAQEKTAFLKLGDNWYRPYGATPTSHIFKLPIGELGQSGIDLSESIENEWLCQQILDAFGIPIAVTEMMKFGEQKVLVVERFDRRWSADRTWLMRLPQEDMCQAAGISGSLKYGDEGGPGMRVIMDILLGSKQSHRDRTIFMTGQLLFWMLAAIDGHAKNFSIFHMRRGLYRMAPLYDVMSVHPIIEAGQIDKQRVRMAMAVQGKSRHYRQDMICRRHWLEAARKLRFSQDDMADIIERCCDQINGVINDVSDLIPRDFPEIIADAVFSGLRSSRERLVKERELNNLNTN